MSQQLQQIQSYLRNQIIGNQYDPQEFAQFCQQKGCSIDIQTWTLTELRNVDEILTQIVKQFISLKSQVEKCQEASSFMKYQQDDQNFDNLDLDLINIESINSNAFQPSSNKVFKLNHSLSLQQKPVCKQQSSIWGPQSQATVTIKNIDQFDINSIHKHYNSNNNNNNIIEDDDGFGDFSSPSNQKSFMGTKKQQILNEQPQVDFNKKNIKQQFKNVNKLQSHELQKINNNQYSQHQKIVKPQQKQLHTYKSQIITSFNKVQKANDNNFNYQSKLQNFNIKTSKNYIWETVPCIKAKVRTILAQPNLTVQVTGHEVINRSFVLPSQVIFTLSIQPNNIEVKRKYPYFIRLRQVLFKFYPNTRLPHLEKGAWLSDKGVQQIKTQKLMIQGFINDILMNPQLRNCRILQQFLTITDNNILKQKFLEYQKLSKLKCIQQMCLLKGQVDVNYSDQHQQYFQKLGPFIDNIQSGIQSYKLLVDKLSSLYQNLIKTYTQLEQVFVNIDNSINTFKSQSKLCKLDNFQMSLKGINDHYRQLNTNVRIESKSIERQFKNFWIYQSSNIGSIRQLLDVRTKITDYYLKNYSDTSKLETYKGNKKLEQYKIGIGQISKNPIVMRYQMGFYNAAALEESIKWFQDFSKKVNKKIICITAERYLSRIKDLNDFYKGQKKLGKEIQ